MLPHGEVATAAAAIHDYAAISPAARKATTMIDYLYISTSTWHGRDERNHTNASATRRVNAQIKQKQGSIHASRKYRRSKIGAEEGRGV